MERTGLQELLLETKSTVVYQYVEYDTDLYILDAPYQRGSVWTIDQRRALIRSLLIGLPVGSVVVSHLGYDKAEFLRVVDGKQRIETLRMFRQGEFGVPLEWFSEAECPAPAADGLAYWENLSPRGQRKLHMCPFPTIEFNATTEYRKDGDKTVRRPRTDEEILRAEAELYLLLNSGGTPHTEEDLARAAGQL